MANEDKNVRLANKFRVEIDGFATDSFSTCEISPAERDVIEDRVGTDPDVMNVSMGLHKTQTVTLTKTSRDFDGDTIDLFAAWYESGDSDKRGGAVDYINKDGNAFHREVFEDAICSKFTAPKVDATTDDKAIFEVVITAPRVQPVSV